VEKLVELKTVLRFALRKDHSVGPADDLILPLKL